MSKIHLGLQSRTITPLIVCLVFTSPAQSQQQGTAHSNDQQTDQPNATQTHAQTQSRPGIEKERAQATQQAEKAINKEAVAVIIETQKAIKAAAEERTEEAIAALEKAIGKINTLVARHPSTALLPVDFSVEVIDAAPLDTEAIKELAKAVEREVDQRDFPAARVLLQGLISEIRIRTYHLPLATYPIGMREAARLLDQKKNRDAETVLRTALSTLVIIDRVTPLPLVFAQTAIDQAQSIREQKTDEALPLLATARYELERAKELGYMGKDPAYLALKDAISDIELQIKNSEDTASAFSKLKQKIASFFKTQSENEKKSELASK